MATLQDVLTGIRAQLATALSGVSGAQVGTEWPSADVVQTVTQGKKIVAVTHKLTVYKALNHDYQHSLTQGVVSIQSTISDISLAPGQSKTITIALANGQSSVTQNDAVSCQISNGDTTYAVTAIAGSSDTVNTMATALAAAINGNTSFTSTGITATASGAVVTIANGGTIGFYLASACGNTATLAEAVKWALRNIQITAWAGDLTSRYAVQNAVETLLGGLDDGYGFALTSGEILRVRMVDWKSDDTNAMQGIYSDVFIIEVDHEVDVTSTMYEVLATIPSQAPY